MAIPSQIPPRRKTPPKGIKEQPELGRAVAFVGLFTRVAQSLGVSPTHVIEVAKQRRTSSRVATAIIREVRRIERSTERAA
jgi:DNA-binding transcriptional regulator YdaS (Cro superfamily)